MTYQHPNTCTVNGATVYVRFDFTNVKDNLYIQYIEYHKSSSVIIDQEMLSKLNQSSEGKILKKWRDAKLVLSFENILEWDGGDERDQELKVYNYSTASTVDKKLIRSEEELEKLTEELQEGDTFDILREDPYESKEVYIIFHHLHSIDNFIDENENV
jgi:hypothetical protein